MRHGRKSRGVSKIGGTTATAACDPHLINMIILVSNEVPHSIIPKESLEATLAGLAERALLVKDVLLKT